MGACRSAATSFITPAGPLKDIAQARELLDTWLQHWSAKGYGQWAIATREAPQDIIGFGGLDARRYLDIERVNLGYRFAVSVWGKGYATELSDAALEYGFGELGLGEIFALVRPDHGASIKVLEKAGLLRVDVLHDVLGQPPSLVFKASRPEVLSA